ncbi:hypothetical protein SAMIE_1015470 [Sphingobium amiense]|uniref:Uncharacterized protein n=1 Tax=Sphingobium amiense TaxID=135719 RepID=A0A494W3X2_9SPHN|nr:hypothetical protein [Sphingobium amiense]BBD98046.1 hypothetical protein SAMIE_1015470 [Sphingobium amiense]
MPLPDLESRTEKLFSKSDQLLGDTITVVMPGSDPVTIKRQVSHRDKTRVLDFAAATAQDILIELDKATFPTRPQGTWRITLPRLPGRTFAPAGANTDESGFYWEVGVKEVKGA